MAMAHRLRLSSERLGDQWEFAGAWYCPGYALRLPLSKSSVYPQRPATFPRPTSSNSHLCRWSSHELSGTLEDLGGNRRVGSRYSEQRRNAC